MKNKNDNLNRLVDELSNIDDEIILSAIDYKVRRTAFPWKKVVSIAACFALVVIGVFSALKISSLGDRNSGVMEDSFSSKHYYAVEDGLAGDAQESPNETPNKAPNKAPNVSENEFRGDDLLEDGVGEDEEVEDPSNGEQLEEKPDYPSNNVPPITSEVKIDNLDKLAYYSGWTMLRQYGNNNVNRNFVSRGIKGMKSLQSTSMGFGIDVSEMDEYFESADIYWESIDSTVDISEEYSGLIPIDPGFDGEVVAYAVYKITVNSAKYFRFEMYESGFLAEQIGKGNVEVMILDVEIENAGKDTMIVFKNGERYFSCFLETLTSNSNKDSFYRFNASKYISKFSIVKMPSLSEYYFDVSFLKNAGSDELTVTGINFSAPSYDNFVFNQSVSLDTYNFASNVSISNTAYDLDEELYKIYLEEVAAGVTKPILPEIPNIPDNSNDSYSEVKIDASLNGVFSGEGSFDDSFGYYTFKGKSEEIAKLKTQFPDDDFVSFADSIPEDMNYVVAWIKGDARLSDYRFVNVGAYRVLELEYILFGSPNSYTVFVFELAGDFEVNEVKFPPTDYSTTVEATFTTENEYDNTDETDDEYIINLGQNAMYQLYKNEQLIYECGYKVSGGYVCLCTDNNVFYLELSNESTFVYELDGVNRIFKLI